ncbi:MAG: hypothetical protein HXX16_20575 [Bacteroidales bacterium]|nr:hypothetical protein [Bacteroidales bacterium]
MKIRKRLYGLNNNDLSEEKWGNFIEEISSALGSFVITFNCLDQLITVSIVHLLGPLSNEQEEQLYLIISKKHFAQRLQDLENLTLNKILQIQPGEQVRIRINNLFKEIYEINERRNKYIHADWYDTEDHVSSIIVRSKTRIDPKGIYHEYFKCSVEEIESDEERCDLVIDKLEKIINEIMK